jgi:NAD(P)-dependent dehydrogenase (short-subunit alcohol dehydrogenase family)
VVAYLTTMLVNPNNHALDGGPATGAMEKEVVAQLAGMFGLVAAVVAFLASAHASAVTGAVVTVDCGTTAVDLPTTAFDPT